MLDIVPAQDGESGFTEDGVGSESDSTAQAGAACEGWRPAGRPALSVDSGRVTGPASELLLFYQLHGRLPSCHVPCGWDTWLVRMLPWLWSRHETARSPLARFVDAFEFPHVAQLLAELATPTPATGEVDVEVTVGQLLRQLVVFADLHDIELLAHRLRSDRLELVVRLVGGRQPATVWLLRRRCLDGRLLGPSLPDVVLAVQLDGRIVESACRPELAPVVDVVSAAVRWRSP